jgi:hypothetical protein
MIHKKYIEKTVKQHKCDIYLNMIMIIINKEK